MELSTHFFLDRGHKKEIVEDEAEAILRISDQLSLNYSGGSGGTDVTDQPI